MNLLTWGITWVCFATVVRCAVYRTVLNIYAMKLTSDLLDLQSISFQWLLLKVKSAEKTWNWYIICVFFLFVCFFQIASLVLWQAYGINQVHVVIYVPRPSTLHFASLVSIWVHFFDIHFFVFVLRQIKACPHTCQGYSNYFWEPHGNSMGLPEISRVIWQVWYQRHRDVFHNIWRAFKQSFHRGENISSHGFETGFQFDA